jgi:hypothetical protein
MARKKGEHYVNNKEFSQAVIDYVKSANKAEAEGKDIPTPSKYIGDCFIKICYKLASRPNFYGYSYKDDMVLDGIENCVKAIGNFDADKAVEKSQSGNVNAFGYFTRIVWFAFLRRIQKEKKQQSIKDKFMDQADASEFFEGSNLQGNRLMGSARNHNDMLKHKDKGSFDYTPEEKKLIKRAEKKEQTPRGLENFYE